MNKSRSNRRLSCHAAKTPAWKGWRARLLATPLVLLSVAGAGVAALSRTGDDQSEEVRARLARIAEAALLSDRSQMFADPLHVIRDLDDAGYSFAYDKNLDAYVTRPMRLLTNDDEFRPTYTLQVQYLSGGLEGRTVEFFNRSHPEHKRFDTIRVVCAVEHDGHEPVHATRYVMLQGVARR